MDFQKTLAWVIEDAQRMWEFRWVGLLCAWIIAAGGWLTVQLLPNKYEASARVYVNAEGILKPLLRDLTVPTDPIEQVKLMTRALLSRPHLETVITKTGLVDRARNPAERERLLLRLEETILVMRPQEADDDQVYTIAYDDHDPAMAQAVVQTLLDDFITDSMTGDVAESAQAQAFLEGQLKIYEQRLTDAENRLAGIFTDGDLRRVLDRGLDVHKIRMKDIMNNSCRTIAPGALAAEAVHLLEQFKINALLVVNPSGQVVGALNIHDLLRAGVM